MRHLAGGPARSSEEALVIGVERRGRLICDVFVRATGKPEGLLGGIVWAGQI